MRFSYILARDLTEPSTLDIVLKADQVVTTGTCMTPIPLVPGDALLGGSQFGLCPLVARSEPLLLRDRQSSETSDRLAKQLSMPRPSSESESK